MGRTILLAGAAALALAACSKTADKTASADKAAPAAGAPAAGAPAAGDAAKTAAAEAPSGPPMRKSGLWEQTISSERVNQTMRMCVDEASEQKARWWRSEGRRGAGNSECAEQRVTRTLTGGWSIHAVCKDPGGMTVTTDGTATGDFGDHYHVELTSVTTGSSMPEANGTHKMSMDGAWKGPCPAGWAGGDMELPGGMRVNMLHPEAGPTGGGMGGVRPGQMPSQAEIARMRAQAMEMAKKAQAQ